MSSNPSNLPNALLCFQLKRAWHDHLWAALHREDNTVQQAAFAKTISRNQAKIAADITYVRWDVLSRKVQLNVCRLFVQSCFLSKRKDLALSTDSTLIPYRQRTTFRPSSSTWQSLLLRTSRSLCGKRPTCTSASASCSCMVATQLAWTAYCCPRGSTNEIFAKR